MFVFIFIQLKIFSNFSFNFFFDPYVVEKCVKFNFQTLEDFPVSNLIDNII